MPLTPKQQRFVEEFLIDLNATQAAIRAGYSEKTAKAIGCENLTKPDVAEAIGIQREKISAKAEWSAADRLETLKAITLASKDLDPRVAVSAIGEANKMQGSHAATKNEHGGIGGGAILQEVKLDKGSLEALAGLVE